MQQPVRFWDSSAVVPLPVHEAATSFFKSVYARDGLMTVWWGTKAECASTLARYARDPCLAASKVIADGFRGLEDAASHWNEIAASPAGKELALDLLRRHELRAADALQLAAAAIAGEEKGVAWELVCADKHLLQAAIKEGFEVLAPERA